MTATWERFDWLELKAAYLRGRDEEQERQDGQAQDQQVCERPEDDRLF